jgi:hypothetical protein
VTYRLVKLRDALYALEADGRVIATLDRERYRGYWTAELLGTAISDFRPEPFKQRSHRFAAFASAREWLGWPEIIDPDKPGLPSRWRRRRPNDSQAGGTSEGGVTSDGGVKWPGALSNYERLLRAWNHAGATERERFLDTAGLHRSDPSSSDMAGRPLARVSHELFAQGVAAGLSASRAYALAYGREADGATRASAVRLLGNASVQRRIAEIRRNGEALALRSLLNVVPLLERQVRAAARDGKFSQAMNALTQIARKAGIR